MTLHNSVETSLRRLAALRQRLRELLEWDALAQSERRPHVPPGFDPAVRSRENVRIEIDSAYGAFLQLAEQIQHRLDRPEPDRTLAAQYAWRERLERIRRDLAKLGLGQRFINE